MKGYLDMSRKSTNDKTSIRVKRSLSSKIISKFWRTSLLMVKRFGPSGFLLRVSRAFSEKQPYFYDVYQKGERLVEYAWVLRNLDINKGKILDVGCWGTLFPIMLASLGYKVTGVDMKRYLFKHPNFKFIKGDLLEPSTMEKLGKEKFDVITLVSTLEHLGIELRAESEIDLNADARLLSMLKERLNPDGIIFITTEYGKSKVIKRPIDPSVDPSSYPYKITPWLKLYDEKEIRELIEKTGFVIENKEYFVEKDGHWIPRYNTEVQELEYPTLGASIRSIVCLKLKKPGGT